MMQIRPLYDRVVVKRVEQQRTTASGIVIPDTATEKPEQGEVVAVGQGKLLADGTTHPVAVNVGDRVLFSKYAGQTVKLHDQELLVMREEDILAIIETGQADLKKVA